MTKSGRKENQADEGERAEKRRRLNKNQKKGRKLRNVEQEAAQQKKRKSEFKAPFSLPE